MGFSRKGNSWFRRGEEIVQVVNLQKSRWGNQYYLNYALWLLALGETSLPREEMCHVRKRVDDLVANEKQFNELLDLENDIPAEERAALLSKMLTSDLVPFIDKSSSIAGLRELFVKGMLEGGFVYVDAKRLLE